MASPPGWPRRWRRSLCLLFLLTGRCEDGVLPGVPPPCDVLVRGRATGGYWHMDWAIPGGHRSPDEEGVLGGGGGGLKLRGVPPAVP